MNLFSKEDFEKLSAVKGDACVSIFIPTHASGMEVNEGLDKINLKNKLQEVRNILESKGIKDISAILSEANSLLEDKSFWRSQDESLALFFNSKQFKAYKLPIRINEYLSVGEKFELSPLLPLLAENESYYLLSLNLNNIQLFKNTRFTSREIKVAELIPDTIEEIFRYFNFNNEASVPSTNFEGMKFDSAANQGQAIHSHNTRDKESRYVQDFMSKIDQGLSKRFMEDDIPVILAGAENVCGYYKATSTYKNIESEIIPGVIDRFSEKELLSECLKIVDKSLNKEKKKAIDKYPVWSGTGKTSYDLKLIVTAAHEGRIESLFIVKGSHLWGQYEEASGKTTIHKEQKDGDVCLIDLAAMKTIENSGRAYLVSKDEMPEKMVDTNIAAIFRY